MHIRLLLVEDEVKTGDYLRQRLAEAGFMVAWALGPLVLSAGQTGSEIQALVVLFGLLSSTLLNEQASRPPE